MAAAAMIKSSGTAKTDTMTTDVEKEAASRSASSLSLSGGFLTAEGADGDAAGFAVETAAAGASKDGALLSVNSMTWRQIYVQFMEEESEKRKRNFRKHLRD